MNTLFFSNLIILGNNATGKTSLVSLLTEGINRTITKGIVETKVLAETDWIIPNGNQQILVDIKEAASLLHLKSIIKREKIIILLLLRVDRNNKINPKDENWIKDIKRVAPNAKVIIAFTFVNKEKNISIYSFRKKYPHIEYIFTLPDLVIAQYEEFAEFKTALQQIIINNVTNSLDYAKELISRNIATKNKTLDLGNCSLTSLLDVEELFDAVHLETLILSNEWGVYEGREIIRKVSRNSSGRNILFNIPAKIKRLKNLKVLICGGDWKSRRKINRNSIKWKITDITSISYLDQLQVLNLANNDIENIGSINRLANLRDLYLNNNRISKIPQINRINSIRSIYLSNNNLTNVAFLELVSTIKTIDLHSNNITNLFPIKSLISRIGIEDGKWGINTISVYNNPLTTPPTAVVAHGKRNVLAYFKQLEAEQQINIPPFQNRDIKLILAGNSNAGKTTLVRWLQNQKITTKLPSTHWLEVGTWKASRNGEDYFVRIFDFGGQEYYHDTHHLFFTRRSAYILLWDASANKFDEVEIDNSSTKSKIQIFPLEYWLESIVFQTSKRQVSQSERQIEAILNERDRKIQEAIKDGKDLLEPIVDSSKSLSENKLEQTILVTQSKVDFNFTRQFLNEKSLKSKFSSIFNFCEISVSQGRGLEYLLDNLFEVFRGLELITEQYLGTWGFIKKKIETRIFDRPYSLKEFQVLCNEIIQQLPQIVGRGKNSISKVLFSTYDTHIFVQYLNDIGLVLYYPEHPKLKDRVFLNQQIIIQRIHSILTDLSRSSGQFDFDYVKKILGKLTKSEDHNDTVNLMLHFKIIFEHPSKPNHYIAPLYLPKEPPASIKLFYPVFSDIVYRYKYEGFVHKHIILDFFSEYGKKALVEPDVENLVFYWRDGIVIKDQNTSELIMVKFILPMQTSTGAYVDVFTTTGSYQSNFLKELVMHLDAINLPVGAKKWVSSDGVNFIPLDEVLKQEELGNWLFVYESNIYKLTDFKAYLKNDLKMKKVFISYSKADALHLTKLENHLSVLKRNGSIATWNCRKLMPGDKWDGKIKKELEEADLIIFLVSDDFLATDYIWDVEIKRAIERDNDPNDSVRVVPIIVRECVWEDSPLGVYNTAPKKAEVISSGENIDAAWTRVVRELKQII